MARIGLALLLVASLSAAAAVPIPSQTRGGLPVLPKRGGGKKVDTKVVVKPAPVPACAPASASAASKIKWAGVATVLGGALAHLALGSLYCYANFQSYLPKHLLFLDGADRAGQPDAQYVFPLTLVAQCLGLPLGPMFQRSIGERSTLLLGGFLMATGVLLASYAKTLPVFMLFYSMLFGIGVGIGYTAPIVAGWKWFPQSKGLVSGAVLTGFGAGGFFFTKLGTALINPSNEKPVNGFFPPSVTNGFGSLLRKLSLAYYALSILGSLLVSVPPRRRLHPRAGPHLHPLLVALGHHLPHQQRLALDRRHQQDLRPAVPRAPLRRLPLHRAGPLGALQRRRPALLGHHVGQARLQEGLRGPVGAAGPDPGPVRQGAVEPPDLRPRHHVHLLHARRPVRHVPAGGDADLRPA